MISFRLIEALKSIVVSNSLVETEGKTFANVENARKCVLMIQSHFEACVVPKMTDNYNLMQDLMRNKNEWFKVIEERCNEAVQRQIDGKSLYFLSPFFKTPSM
jgi:hypothetical protein